MSMAICMHAREEIWPIWVLYSGDRAGEEPMDREPNDCFPSSIACAHAAQPVGQVRPASPASA